MEHYYNKKCQEAPVFEKGKKVFLLQRNIKTKQPSNKLDHKKLGLFKISKKIGKLNYKLQLPETMQIYPVFYVLLIEKAPQNAKTTNMEVKDKQEEYEVKQVLGY